MPRFFLFVSLCCLPCFVSADTFELDITGLDGELLENIRASLAILQLSREQKDLDPLHIRRLHLSAADEIRDALKPFGYYQSQIESSLEKTGHHWKLGYRVDAGPPVRVTQVRARVTGAGAGAGALNTLLSQFPLRVGDRLVQALYERFKDNLLATAQEHGYLDARLDTHEIRIDLQNLAATIELTLDTGPLYRFGTVRFENSNLRTELLQRYVPFKPGDPFRNTSLLKLLSNLEDSGYFEYVEVNTEKEQAVNLHIPVTIELNDRKRQKYTLGAGFGTDTGPRVKLAWEQRRLNRHGHKFTVDAQASTILQSFTGRYRIPIRNPHTDQIEFSAGISRQDTVTAKSLLRQLGFSRSLQRGEWQETLGVSYQREDSKTDEVDSSNLFIPSVNWTRLRSDSLLRVTRGSRLSLTLKGALASALSDTSLVQGLAQGKWVRSVGDRTRLLVRGALGGTATTNFDAVPSSLRFYAGGDQALRGYDFRELGPENDQGDVVGGKHLVLASLEIERRLYKKWGVAAFLDAGNAFNDTDLKLKKSAGLGVRWQTPIGPVRVDFAVPLRDTHKGFRVHFTLGPDL